MILEIKETSEKQLPDSVRKKNNLKHKLYKKHGISLRIPIHCSFPTIPLNTKGRYLHANTKTNVHF